MRRINASRVDRGNRLIQVSSLRLIWSAVCHGPRASSVRELYLYSTGLVLQDFHKFNDFLVIFP